MRPAVTGALLICLSWCGEAAAMNIPFRKVSSIASKQRANAVDVFTANTTYGFTNLDDNVYVAEIFVQGQNFSVQLDTGSSDFWVAGSLAPAQALQDAYNTGLNGTNCYLDTTCASGPIIIADTTFGNFSVPGQALVNAIGTNATYGDIMSGLLGLGGPFNSTSDIMRVTSANDSLNGLPFLNNLFDSYPDISNYVTFQLSRTATGDVNGGIFTIGEVAEEWASVQQTAQIPLLLETTWGIGADSLVINGHKLSLNGSALAGSNQLLSLLDTGTARGLARRDIVDALYRDIPGAQFDGCCQYTLPCDTKLNVSITIGEQSFPLHPIDVVIVPEPGEEARADRDANICIGAFSYVDQVDMILGDTFLRNVYALFDYGSWTRADDVAPFVQLLSTTDPGAAWAEFDTLNAARVAARSKDQTEGKLQSGAGRRFSFSRADVWILLWTIVLGRFAFMVFLR